MADVKFTGAIGHKVRPVIVKKRVGNQLVVYEVTSQGCRFATDVQIRDPHSLGLSKASAVKGSRTITIDISDLRQLLHRMSPSECEAIFSRMWYS